MHIGKKMHFLHNPASCRCVHWLLKCASLSPGCSVAGTSCVTPPCSNQIPPDDKTGLIDVRKSL